MSTKNLEVIHPPTANNMGGVVAVSSTAIAAQDTGVASGDTKQLWFVCNCDVYVIFGTATVSAPVVTDVAGATRCLLIPAKTFIPYEVAPRSQYFRAITSGSDTGFLRWYEDK